MPVLQAFVPSQGPAPSAAAVRTSDFEFDLPQALIAQSPAPHRHTSRLLVLHRPICTPHHLHFATLPSLLRKGDLLVLNDSRVIRARLRAANPSTGGRFEMLLLEDITPTEWWVMLKPGKRARVGTWLCLLDPKGKPTPLEAQVLEVNAQGHRRLQFHGTARLLQELDALGEVPLPPYIRRPEGSSAAEDVERYQTVYAAAPGSVAAPTAGLHFTDAMLEALRAAGVELATVTLHVGPGTFAPVKDEVLEAHPMHEERYVVPEATVRRVRDARRQGRRVVAVGTTSLRVLESVAAAHDGDVVAGEGRTRLFVHPPYRFRLIDALLTNFHLPRSTLLMLVCAFADPGGAAGRERVLSAYAEAVRERYRFFSYGDAMWID